MGPKVGPKNDPIFGPPLQKGGGFSWPPTCGIFPKWPLFWTFLDHLLKSLNVNSVHFWKKPVFEGYPKNVFFTKSQKRYRIHVWTCSQKIHYREFQLFWAKIILGSFFGGHIFFHFFQFWKFRSAYETFFIFFFSDFQ